jgi:phosphoserine phosphatase
VSWVIVLTAPAARGLSGAEIAIAAGAAGAPRRLGAAAAEIPCAEPPDLAALRARLEGVDVNAVPARGRRKRILIADMDSTMIPVECIDEVADFAGVKPQVSAITERAMAGELDFEGSLRARVALMAGLPEGQLAHVYAERVRLNPGARVLVRTMAEHGAHTALISGGFTYFAERVAAAAGFAEHRANRLLFADGRLTGKVAEPILGRAAKLEALVALAARLGVTAAEVIAVGDGANDLDMIEAAGLGVAFHAKPALAARAGAVIRHADLTALLHLQGHAEDEFVRD